MGHDDDVVILGSSPGRYGRYRGDFLCAHVSLI
jgi:hypothetical protein